MKPAITLRPMGYGGTGPSPALALLDVTLWLCARSAVLDLAPWRLQRDPLYFFNSLLGPARTF